MENDEKGIDEKGVGRQLSERASGYCAPLGSDSFFADHLSAYIDKEVGDEDRRHAEEHCNHCENCRVMVSQFRSIGRLMRESEQRVDTDAVWDRVAVQLDNAQVVPIPTKSSNRSWVYGILATAASIALLGLVVRDTSKEHRHDDAHQHPSLAVDFQEVFRLTKTEPKAAIAMLVAKYQGQELSRIAATDYLGYEPALFKSVPEGFTRVSTHVLNMPCCKCSATRCERSDGTSLIVFEHKDEQPVWFGDSPSIETQCSGTTCKIIESAGQIAVSWKNQDRQLTIVGANDLTEVNQWVAVARPINP